MKRLRGTGDSEQQGFTLMDKVAFSLLLAIVCYVAYPIMRLAKNPPETSKVFSKGSLSSVLSGYDVAKVPR